LAESAAWYEQQRAGLGQEFLDAALATFRLRCPDRGVIGYGYVQVHPDDLQVRIVLANDSNALYP
jgi:hypothetical protein